MVIGATRVSNTCDYLKGSHDIKERCTVGSKDPFEENGREEETVLSNRCM